MKYRIFTYPVPCDEAVAELNGFLSSHRILRVREELVSKGNDLYLVFIVEYLDGPFGEKTAKPPKVDYREELSEGEFAVFSALRDWRKAHSETEGVPVYTIFTNAQLAEIVQKKVGTIAELGKVDGVGKSRIEKYGETLLKICKDFATLKK
ncbi:MAG: HRDC domain-containing protein [Verrucomicrobiota bacterium]|nr:HRDC domain-containing protein [Verrucomicrobiota bacterium]